MRAQTIFFTFFILFLLLAAGSPGQQEQEDESGHEHLEHAPDPTVGVDREAGEVSFEAFLVRAAGPLEVFLCGAKGRTHETVLAAAVDPEALAEALESLGLTPASKWAKTERDLFALQGDKVLISIELANGTRFLAEDLVLNDYEKRPMRPRGWTFHARRFGQNLPDEIEFTLTFKGLRGSPLSMLDSAHAYRPFANAPLVVRTDVVPKPEEGEETLSVRVVLEPVGEEGIALRTFDQEGAPPASDEEREQILVVARRIDALKGRLAGLREENELTVARRRQWTLEVETAYFDLDLLHEARERRAIDERGGEPDEGLLEWKEFVRKVLATYRESSGAEARAAGASLRVLELRGAGGEEKEIRRQELRVEEEMARVDWLNLQPKLDEARHFIAGATNDASRARYQEALEFLEARARIAQARGDRASLRRQALDAVDPAIVEEKIAALEVAMTADERRVRRYELGRDLLGLRSDLRLYSSPRSALHDPDRAEGIRQRIEEIEEELETLGDGASDR